MVQKKSPFTCVVKGLEQLYQYNYIAEGLLQGTGIDIKQHVIFIIFLIVCIHI